MLMIKVDVFQSGRLVDTNDYTIYQDIIGGIESDVIVKDFKRITQDGQVLRIECKYGYGMQVDWKDA